MPIYRVNCPVQSTYYLPERWLQAIDEHKNQKPDKFHRAAIKEQNKGSRVVFIFPLYNRRIRHSTYKRTQLIPNFFKRPFITTYFKINQFISHPTMENNKIWYSQEFLTLSMQRYLKRKGYTVHQQETLLSGKMEVLLMATGWSEKEIIEIKGYSQSEKALLRQRVFGAAQEEAGLSGFAQSLLSSLLSFIRKYKNDQLPVSLCLPDLTTYRNILNQVAHYFAANKLQFKVYLVKENGEVQKELLGNHKNCDVTTVLQNPLIDLLKS